MTPKVIKCEDLSSPYDTRYVVVDEETGEIIDDAQGYGYKSPSKAWAAFNYKNSGKHITQKKVKQDVRKWRKKHEDFCAEIEDALVHQAKEGVPKKESVKFVQQQLEKECGGKPPFTAREFLNYN